MLSCPFHGALCVSTAYALDKGASGRAEPSKAAPGAPALDLLLSQNSLLAAGGLEKMPMLNPVHSPGEKGCWHRPDCLVIVVTTSQHWFLRTSETPVLTEMFVALLEGCLLYITALISFMHLQHPFSSQQSLRLLAESLTCSLLPADRRTVANKGSCVSGWFKGWQRRWDGSGAACRLGLCGAVCPRLSVRLPDSELPQRFVPFRAFAASPVHQG